MQWRACDVCVVSARDKSVRDPQGARSLERASFTVSTVGIALTVILITIYVAVSVAAEPSYQPECDDYMHNGICYRFMSCEYTRYDCDLADGVYDGFCCYYN